MTDEPKVLKYIGDTVKSIDEQTFGGYVVVFSNPDSPDLEQDFFDHTSYLWPETPTVEVIYDHSMGVHPDQIGDDGQHTGEELLPYRYRVGKVVKRLQDDKGVYIEFKLLPKIARFNEKLKAWEDVEDEQHQEWLELLNEKLRRGEYNFSSDSMTHLAEREFIPSKGVHHIKSWPIPMASITRRAAEPRTRISGKSVDQSDAQASAHRAERSEQSTRNSPDSHKEFQSMKFDKKRLTRAVVESQWKSIFAAIKADAIDEEETKAEGDLETDEVKTTPGEIQGLLQPVAESIGSLCGCSPDEIMPDLLSMVMGKLSSYAKPADATASVDAGYEDPMMSYEDDPMMSYDEFGEDPTMSFDDFDQDPTMSFEYGDEDVTSMYEEEDGSYMSKRKSLAVDPAAVAKAYQEMNNPRGAAVLNKGGKYKTIRFNRQDPDKNPYKMGALIKNMIAHKLGDPRAGQKVYHLHQQAVKSYKAQGTNPDTSGGLLVVPERTGEVIESIKAAAVVAPMLRERPMKSNVLEVPRVETGATITPTGENAQLTTTEVELGMERAYAVKMGALLKFSDEIRAYSEEDAESVFRDELEREVPVELDSQILRGSGVGNELLGLENRPVAVSGVSRGITVTSLSGALAYTDLTQMQERLEDTDLVLNDSVHWLIDPKVKRLMRELEDTSGRLIFTGGGEGTQMSGAPPSYILDYTWKQSNLIVETPKPAARKLYLNKWDEIYLGIAKQLEVRLSDEAGTSFEYDQVWIRAIMRVALLVRQPEAIHILDNISS